MIWRYLQRKLGILDIQEKQYMIHEALLDSREILYNNFRNIYSDVAVHNRALARIIAKLDPMYGVSEFDPARKAASDEIGERVMERLKAEAEVEAKYRGEPK